MVRNIKILEGKQYSTRKIRKVIIEEEDSESVSNNIQLLKQKNRQSAQRSRDNKKKFMANMELKIAQLEMENHELKQKLEQSDKKVQLLQSRLGVQFDNQCQMKTAPVIHCQQISNETESGKDSFQRLSAKSFVSCGNFLMIAMIAVCCIFGLFQSSVQMPFSRSLYSTQSLDHIVDRIRSSNMEASQVKEIQVLVKRLSPKDHGFPSYSSYSSSKDSLSLNKLTNELKSQI